MWDERYSSEEYAYGKAPNTFLERNFEALPKGKILSLAEGEGRNAVFLASQGYSVTAVDSSRVGLEKAKALAAEREVDLKCIHADLSQFDLGVDAWDGVISIFCPLPSPIRIELYRRLVPALKQGGVFLLEAYTPAQLLHGTGGGNSADVMQTKESVLHELPDLTFSHLAELEREVIEGRFHTGIGSVVQAIGTKH